MRLALVDLLFSWPPNGGADVDMYHTAAALQRAGHDVRLFGAGYEKNWERGNFEPESLPFPAERLDFTTRTLRPKSMAKRFRAAVDASKPDAVIVGDGFFYKPAVIEALAHYPIAARYYAYEAVCPRDLLLYKNGAPCPMNYLRTPNVCRPCAVAGMRPIIQRWRLLSWQHEFLGAGAFIPAYHAQHTNALGQLDAAIVYNTLMAAQLENLVDQIFVVPGGVHAGEYPASPLLERDPGEKKIILMTGRVEDPLKGLSVLLSAGERLATRRTDFEIWATHTDPSLNSAWFKSIGWHPHEKIKDFYQQADIAVVPSVWEEPFGMVAVEAMACGRPVVASRVGGLQHIVTDGETGLLFDREDAAALAAALERLLDDAALRETMGAAARQRVEHHYDWDQVIAQYWPPIIERLAATKRRGTGFQPVRVNASNAGSAT